MDLTGPGTDSLMDKSRYCCNCKPDFNFFFVFFFLEGMSAVLCKTPLYQPSASDILIFYRSSHLPCQMCANSTKIVRFVEDYEEVQPSSKLRNFWC